MSPLRQPQPPTSTSPLGEFEFLNTKGNPNGWNDPRFEKLWLYNLHYFDYLNNGVEVEGRGGQWKDEIVLKWIRENPKGWGNGWEPYPISLRVVNWIKWLKCEQGTGNKELVRKSLCEQMKWLYPRSEYHLLANHLLANAKALVFAGKFLGNEKWYEQGMAIYRKELPEQTCADGVNFERSPMYHCIILEDVLECFELLRSEVEAEKRLRSAEDKQLFREYAEKMLAGLKLLTGPDGKISKFNDSTEGIAKSPAELFAYAERLNIHCQPQPSTSTFSSSSGFIRQEAGQWTLLAKCGDIGPSYQPGHAHADTGSFELWKGGRKIIGDTGCSTYVPGLVRSYERSTAAHNTVVIDGQNSSEVWAAHRVARRSKVLGRETGAAEGEVSYRDFHGFEIRRKLSITEAGLRGEDEICGSGEHVVEVRWHLPLGVGEDEVNISCNGERQVEPCEFAVGWNKREPGLCVICRQTAKLPAVFTWSVA